VKGTGSRSLTASSCTNLGAPGLDSETWESMNSRYEIKQSKT